VRTKGEIFFVYRLTDPHGFIAIAHDGFEGLKSTGASQARSQLGNQVAAAPATK
jgi:hypothetical protein